MFEAWNVAKGRKVQGGRILSQDTVYVSMSSDGRGGNIWGVSLKTWSKELIWSSSERDNEDQPNTVFFAVTQQMFFHLLFYVIKIQA